MKIKKPFYIICSVVVLAGVGFFVIPRFFKDFRVPDQPLVMVSPGADDELENPDEPLVAVGQGSVKGKRYVHENPTFSFDCSGCSPGSIRDDLGETILLKNFQIYITRQDETFEVTRERIAQDAPDVLVSEPKAINVSGAKGLVFKSKDSSGSPSREVWFANAGYLYQLTGLPDAELDMSAVVGSWKF